MVNQGMLWGLVCLFLAFLESSSFAYVIMRSGSGAEGQWTQGSNISIRANTVNDSSIAPIDLHRILTTSFLRWKQAANDSFSIQYTQGSNPTQFPNTISSSNNVVFFTSNAADDLSLDCNVVAVTLVSMNVSTGEIYHFSMRLNDKCFQFKANESEVTSYKDVFLGDVVTHEFGHALGLDHSQNLQSTMLPTVQPEMSILSCDDTEAMLHSYVPSITQKSGTIQTRILSPSGTPVFGAHVIAISLDRGIAVASSLTEKDGTVTIGPLEVGTYTLLVEPLYIGPKALNRYYSNINASVCDGGKTFERTFVQDVSTKLLKTVTISAATTQSFGDILVKCSTLAAFSTTSKPVLALEALKNPLAIQDILQVSESSSTENLYFLGKQKGKLTANALSFSLFSPIDVQVDFLDTSGKRIDPQVLLDDVFRSNTNNFINYDSSASIELATEQDVYLRVVNRRLLPSYMFPLSASGAISITPFFVLTVGPTRDTTSMVDQGALLLANNPRCESADAFSAYPYTPEPKSDVTAPNDSGTKEEKSHGFLGCGTLENDDGNGEPPTAQSVGSFAFFLMLLLAAWRSARFTNTPGIKFL